MFFGESRHNMDDKGRLILPAKFREDLGAGFVMTKGLDNCIFIFPSEEWKVMENKLKSLPMTNKEARAFVRYFFAGASYGSFDKQGRIKIPQNLIDYADLEKESIIIGVGTRLEIWAEGKWEDYTHDDSLSYNQIAETMSELGI
ncbi:MAG: division/cell wall cluster transcriptional repressor MraZ [Tissierellia bacterium]|nr:division/cell wall cluster transcriptional repressor MraZ [Tissierellia bacterium]